MLRPIGTMPAEECRRIRGILFDIDDTFTHEGRIIPAAFAALWELQRCGLRLIPITGRPAGWCDHIARMWPVDGVVGENGAFYYHYDRHAGRLRQRYVLSPKEMASRRAALDAIWQEIQRRVPGAALASDQAFRLFDLAVDFREDVPALDDAQINEICRIFLAHRAVCKVSSIHVNGWFGDYDKLSTTRLMLEELFEADGEQAQRDYLFIGDSPNDEPMFAAFELTVGVANIERFLSGLKARPVYVTRDPGGYGFAEMAQVLLARRTATFAKASVSHTNRKENHHE